MATSVYTINKGVNRSLEFRGLRAQYITYLALGLVLLLLLFTLLYLAGAPVAACLAFIALAGAALFGAVYHLNNTYGEYGLLKMAARRQVPACIRICSRHLFLQLNTPHKTGKEEVHGSAH
ncbi:DUF4133 domain-containing protein [Pontibacter silvestris]|uniref:DUF4133 domain-containing protein n=1 Tax=Pontibacter silvestris TaxID=2305183 RepID=A0ABW4WZW5_9BACT|nr:DUF4133 domain-containing protein [Pontibacter silvestris]MCC9137519.1 DUF4133 domain-containing protein [Pontibacter silvestris]